ncbi:hypothetical protein [Pseudomonas putida]|uniref:hypothetical protein n=1 Tax=Pseudomonas putida TaxID=303 RepID=UPI00095191A6|nr:hypothetical protein [Pseudomonas putida]
MKKLVPDPPPVLCIRAGMSTEEAIHNAEKHLQSALFSLTRLPSQPLLADQTKISSAIVNLKISRTLLTVARAKSGLSVPVQ